MDVARGRKGIIFERPKYSPLLDVPDIFVSRRVTVLSVNLYTVPFNVVYCEYCIVLYCIVLYCELKLPRCNLCLGRTVRFLLKGLSQQSCSGRFWPYLEPLLVIKNCQCFKIDKLI
jgi:hypothetical protein